MSNLVIVARVGAKPGFEKALVAAQAELVQVVRKQPGCISYELHEDLDHPGHVVFFERWTSTEDWERHMNGAHMDAFRSNAGRYIGAFELTRMRQVA